MAAKAPICFRLNRASPATPPLREPADRWSFLVGQHLNLSFPNSCSGTRQRACTIVSSKFSGLEEAMRIRRARELQSSVKVRKRPPLRRGKVSGKLLVPDHISRPPYVDSGLLPELSSEHQVHDEEGIARMRAACKLAAQVLEYAGTLVRHAAIML